MVRSHSTDRGPLMSRKRRLQRSEKPVVCLIVTSDVSAFAFFDGYLRYLVESGWAVVVIASSDGGLKKFAAAQGAEGVVVAMRRDPAPLNDFVSTIRLIRALAARRPNVVVTATPKAGLIGTFAAWMCRVPVRVYQLWGLRFETERGMRRRILSWMERASMRLATQVVANSASLARQSRALGVGRSREIDVLGPGSSHGVDVEFYSPLASTADLDDATAEFLQRRSGDIVVGFVGRIHEDKGIDTLLGALHICASRGLKIDLLIVGPGEDEDLMAKLSDAREGLSIQIVGAVPDTRPYFRSMDVHCLPTLREGFPNVVLEAAAMGVCTITTTATGAVDSVVDGQTGILVPVLDDQALADALELVARDPEYRQKLSAQARSTVQQVYSTNIVWPLLEGNLRRQHSLAQKGTRG